MRDIFVSSLLTKDDVEEQLRMWMNIDSEMHFECGGLPLPEEPLCVVMCPDFQVHINEAFSHCKDVYIDSDLVSNLTATRVSDLKHIDTKEDHHAYVCDLTGAPYIGSQCLENIITSSMLCEIPYKSILHRRRHLKTIHYALDDGAEFYHA